eukprot:244118-Chlamydomonas_euryale.AAC.3
MRSLKLFSLRAVCIGMHAPHLCGRACTLVNLCTWGAGEGGSLHARATLVWPCTRAPKGQRPSRCIVTPNPRPAAS